MTCQQAAGPGIPADSSTGSTGGIVTGTTEFQAGRGRPAAVKITPFLWFDDNGAQAIEFYRGVFPDCQRVESVGPCGWLTDKFGVSWRIVPTALGRLLGDPDRENAGRVMQAMLKMRKIEIAGLEGAYAG
jgi:predicted 3-demethylubiquinone-9 3-methyltransferase (glyoxalase superfamily)